MFVFKLYYFTLRHFNRFQFCFSYLRMWPILRINRVKFARNIRFLGLTKISCISPSSIVIGEGCTFLSLPTSNLIGINRPCIISTHKSSSKITIGKNVGFSGTVIGCFDSIIIGDNVLCGANTLITDGDWHETDTRSGKPSAVVIEDGVWLGTGVTILKGVRIGANSLIGAGSVVLCDIPPNVVAAGIPCKVIKSLK